MFCQVTGYEICDSDPSSSTDNLGVRNLERLALDRALEILDAKYRTYLKAIKMNELANQVLKGFP